MFEYLKQLKWPEDWKDFVDLFSKTVVAGMSTVIAVGIWWYAQHQQALAEAQKEQAAALDKMAQKQQRDFDNNLALLRATLTENSDKRDNITLFLDVLPKDGADPLQKLKTDSLTAYCNDEMSNANSRPGALLSLLCKANADKVSSLAQQQRADADQAARTAVSSGDAGAYVNSSAAATQVAGLAAVEAATDATDSKGQWFAVLASLPLTQVDEAMAVAKSLNAKIGAVVGACDIHIYETKISRSFAITSGGPKAEAAAKARARLVRQSGLVADAFAQPNRDWGLSVRARQPRWSSKAPCG
jgi:hypothetical protein